MGKEGGLTGNPALHACREGLCEIITGLRLPCSSDSGLAFSSDDLKIFASLHCIIYLLIYVPINNILLLLLLFLETRPYCIVPAILVFTI